LVSAAEQELAIAANVQRRIHRLHVEANLGTLACSWAVFWRILDERSQRKRLARAPARRFALRRSRRRSNCPFAVMLRFKSAPVAPLTGMPESSSALKALVAVARALRSSCARKPARRFLPCSAAAPDSPRAGAELGHRIGDRIVETPFSVLNSDVREGCIALEGQIGDRLAEVTVVVHDLIDRVAQGEEFLAVGGRRHLHFGHRQGITADGRKSGGSLRFGRQLRRRASRQLVEEQRDAVRELLASGGAFWALRDLQLAAHDQIVAVVEEKDCACQLCMSVERSRIRSLRNVRSWRRSL
jgi:hypothetical protein